ncbi:hypothetical protein POX60_01190 [Escherichia coli]|nr:hypothetical protein [Escherichia coli]EIO2238290.1 hypothetical protein [Escherichia coli]EJA7629908.1 hypothetical protein [Escherichia coli]
MAEAEMLKMIRRITGASQAAGKQEATQPDSVIAENYARVVAEVMRRDDIYTTGRSRSGYGSNSLRLKKSSILRPATGYLRAGLTC